MQKKCISSSRGKTFYWIEKCKRRAKNTIVFTHGVTLNHSIFEKQVEYFKEYYNIITWDVPLHGESIVYKNITCKNILDDLKTILDLEGISKVILVGMSMGGYISQHFAIENSQRVKALIAIDSAPIGLKYYSLIDKLCVKAAKLLGRIHPECFVKYFIAKISTYTKTGYRDIIKVIRKDSQEQIYKQYELLYTCMFYRKRSFHFNFPVLIIVGEKDRVTKVINYSKRWAADEGYAIEFIDNAGHYSNGDNAKEVNNAIIKFFNLNDL